MKSATLKTAGISKYVLSCFLLIIPALLVNLAYLSHYWVSHPEKKWLAWSLGLIFALVVTMSTLGLLAALGVLPRPG